MAAYPWRVGVKYMEEEITISVLVPPNSPILSQDLRDTIGRERPGNTIAFKKSPDKYCHVHVDGGICPADTWWAINKLVLQVERRHRSGRAVHAIR